jgi:hypothetical protein
MHERRQPHAGEVRFEDNKHCQLVKNQRGPSLSEGHIGLDPRVRGAAGRILLGPPGSTERGKHVGKLAVSAESRLIGSLDLHSTHSGVSSVHFHRLFKRSAPGGEVSPNLTTHTTVARTACVGT